MIHITPEGRLWEVEHGPRGGDELNVIEKGKNYGRPVIVHGINYPGTTIGDAIVEKAGMEQPRYYWDPVIAPGALAFYKGNLGARIRDVQVFPDGAVYVLTEGANGRLLKITPKATTSR